MVEEIRRALSLVGTRIVDGIANFLPGLLVLLLLLTAALIVAAIVRYAVFRALNGLNFDRRAELLGAPLAEWTPSRSASKLVASAAYWTILLTGLLLGLTALDAALPSQFATSVLQYVPHLVAALAIMVLGAVIARFLARAVLIEAVNMGIQSARLLSLAVKWMVLIVAAAMALDHIGIGRTAMLLAFGIMFGGIVLASALAVGLGAKDVVRRALERQMRQPSSEDKLDHV
jgi:Mechanosensitive ion channel, conserved TM helix